MKICIDAGHNNSGWDTGASGFGLREQDISFDIAKCLKENLEALGFDVILTRNKREENIGKNLSESINRRVKIANSQNADLFVSIHANAGGGMGTETYVYCKGSAAEKYAKEVQKSIVKKLNTADRGVKERKNLGVLKYTKMPAILFETAFIDNKEDNLILRNAKGFGKAISDGIYSAASPDIIDVLAKKIEINDIEGAKAALKKAKEENSSLYWILYKLVMGGVV